MLEKKKMFQGKVSYENNTKKTKKHETYVLALNETLDVVKDISKNNPGTLVTSLPYEKYPENIFFEVVEVNSDKKNEIVATILATLIGLMIVGIMCLI